MLAAALCAYSGAFLAQRVLAPNRWSRLGWIAFSALTIYAHGFAVLGIAGQVASLWFLPAATRRELHWIRDGSLIALLAAPAILAPLLQISNGEIGFISRPGLNEMRGLVWSMSGRTITAVPAIGLGVLVAVLIAVNVWRTSLHSVDAFRFALPVLWMIVPTLVLMLASYVHPIWLDRYVLWSLGAVVILAAYGLVWLTRDRVVVAVIMVLVVAALASRGVVKWYGTPANQDYHSAMTQLAPGLRAGDAMVFSPDEVRLPSEFYLRTAVDLHELRPVFPAQDWGKFKTGDEHIDHLDQRVVERLVAHPLARLWIVSYASRGVIVPKMNELRIAYRVESDRRYDGRVEVALLVAR
jgi:mannosyltransferase